MRISTTNIITIIFAIHVISCSNNKLDKAKKIRTNDSTFNLKYNLDKSKTENKIDDKNTAQIEIKDFFITNFEKKFSHKNIKKFKPRFVENEIYKKSDKINGNIINERDFGTIFQKSNINLSNYDYSPIYYSIQHQEGFQSVTVIGMDEDWCFKVCLLNYNMNGKLIGNEYLYESGGDGGFSTDAWGEYVNDSTYIKTKLEIEPDEKDSKKNYCDSIITKIKIDYKGEISTQELYRKRFRRKR